MSEPAYAPSEPAYAPTKGRDAQIPCGLERHGATIDELHNIISQIEGKLEAVRLPGPEQTEDASAPMSVLAPIAQTIANYTATLEGAITRLRTLLHEIEL